MDIRQNILNSLAVLGLSQYQFCKRHGIALSNFSAFLNGGSTLGVEKLQRIMAVLTAEIANLKRFLVRVVLSNGNRINSRVSAINGDVAIKRIMSQPEFLDFIGDATITKATFEEIPVGEPVAPENYVLQPSTDKGWWVCTDKKRNIVCKFKEGDFQNTQKNTILFEDKDTDELEVATAMREMGDYLQAHHADKL